MQRTARPSYEQGHGLSVHQPTRQRVRSSPSQRHTGAGLPHTAGEPANRPVAGGQNVQLGQQALDSNSAYKDPTMQSDPQAEAESFATVAATEPLQEPTQLPMAVNLRSASLVVIAVLISIYVLQWASAVFIPLLLGVVMTYALSPAVDQLQRWHIPRALGAGGLLIALLLSIGATAYSLADDATALVDSLPEAAQKVRQSVRSTSGNPPGSIEKVQQAAAKLEQAAEESGSATPAASKGVTRVQIERPRFNIKTYLWTSTLGLASLLGQAMVVVFLTFFMLASGNSFRRKLVRMAGPTFNKRRITVQVLDEITDQIQHYLKIQIFTSVLVGLATWLAMSWIGLEHAAVWGLVAGVLNLVPYLGSVVTTAGLALVGFLQFGTPAMALLIGGVALLINTIEGNLLTPCLTGRVSRMNPVVIFVGVLACGWLWGLWGLFLGPPLLMIVKSVCDRVDDLKMVGELLSA